MDEYAVKKQLNQKRKKESKQEEKKVQFPWFMFITSVIGDIMGWANVIMILASSGIWITVSATIWNIVQVVIHGSHYVWYKFFSQSGVSPQKKNQVESRLIVNKIISVLTSWMPLIGDMVPTLTLSTLVHYSIEKSKL